MTDYQRNGRGKRRLARPGPPRRPARDWAEAGVRPRLHATLPGELRRADLLPLADCAEDGCTTPTRRLPSRKMRSSR